MEEESNKIQALSDKLDRLLAMHNNVSTEIDELRVEIIRLKVNQKQNNPLSDVEATPANTDEHFQESTESNLQTLEEYDAPIHESDQESMQNVDHGEQNQSTLTEDETSYFKIREKAKKEQLPPMQATKKFDIEKLIGENLINKIGILILVLGVGIGAKYSIENDLISPLGRIILGYIVGILLIVLGMWLKKKYNSFSAVLVSGAMAIFYFITFFAFNFYQLIGQEVAFGLMVIFTIFTVLAALNYDKQIIAHLGLVGAAGVPFLLSNDSGNILFLFSYLTLINLGIAYISLRKHWKILFYSSFVITWLIYSGWLIIDYDGNSQFTFAFSFLAVFFILFYIIFIAYKFLNSKQYNAADIIILLINSMIFFGVGYGLISEYEGASQFLGIFAIVNACIHFTAAYIINKRKLADRNLFYLIIGLVLVCLTLAIPIQLDGQWVTMMWAAEALVLFWIGRSKGVLFYEYISYALMGIATISLLEDWDKGYSAMSISYYPTYIKETNLKFLLNPLFLTSVIVTICFGGISWLHNIKKWKEAAKQNNQLIKILDYALPIFALLVAFFALRVEIANYFAQIYEASKIEINTDSTSYTNDIYDTNIIHKSNLWLINYALIFFILLSFFVISKMKSIKIKWVIIVCNVLSIFLFLTQGLYSISELRENYLNQVQADYYDVNNSFVWIRYVSLGLIAILILFTYNLLKNVNKDYKVYMIAETLFYLVIFWVTTSELIQWLDYTKSSDIYGLALSIYFGVFSLIVIALGIWKKKKHLRILGIAIFAITIAKLFFYDLSNLTTIAKTIVMISLGVLLLLTSFLYNKYTIEDEELQ